MKFIDLLNEKFYKSINITLSYYPKPIYIEIFKNSSTKEAMEQFIDNQRGLRIGIQDKLNGDIYIWKGSVLHNDIVNHIDFDIGLVYSRTSRDILKDIKNDLMKSKYKKKHITKLKKMFPRVTKIETTDGTQFI